jgi:hypothetical protein
MGFNMIYVMFIASCFTDDCVSSAEAVWAFDSELVCEQMALANNDAKKDGSYTFCLGINPTYALWKGEMN